MAPIRLAVVGVGKIARDQHLPAILGDPRFALVATVDRAGGADGVPGFADLAGLRASGIAIDAVTISTPPQVRGDIARAAIAAGFHVLLEKPPAATLAELADLSDRAAAAGVTLFAAWHSRFAPMVEDAATWLAGREIAGGRIDWLEDVRRWHPGQGWLWEAGGLGVFDPAINAFSILTAILPAAVRITEARLEVPANAQTPVAATLALRCHEVAIACRLDFLETVDPRWDIAIETRDGGRLLLGDGGAAIAIDGAPVRRARRREYPALYDRFARLIAAGESDADAAPLRLVADALLVGETHPAPPFVE